MKRTSRAFTGTRESGYCFLISLVALFLLFLLPFTPHPAFAQEQALRDATSANPPSVSATPTPGDKGTANDAVASAVDAFIHEFDGACFSDVVKIGDPAIYQAAARNQLTIQDGLIGTTVTGNRAQGSHTDGTWATNAWIFLPWHVRTIGDNRKKQQTVWHEMTHHIEWLTGRKRSGNDRNTNYMDQARDAFNGWRKMELDVWEGRRTPESARVPWNALVERLRQIEGGSTAGGQPPDSDLEAFTGFRARIDDVIALYRSGSCKDALRELANADEALQERLEKGAKIVTAKPSFVLGNPGELELQVTDDELKKELEDGTLTLSWRSIPKGTFRQIGDSLKTRFTASKPGTVKISAGVETRGPQKKNGTVQLDVPVTVPNDFLRLTLEPKKLDVNEKGKATTDIEFDWNSRFIYLWRGENCEVEKVNRLSTTFTATKPGTATVSVELQIEDADGNRISLITKSATFTVDKSPGEGDKKEPAPGDKKDGQKPPPQVQPDSYKQPWGQAGIQGGTSGQAGITSGVSGQAGITPGDPSTTSQTPGGTTGTSTVTGTGKDTPVSGQAGITSGVSTGVGIGTGAVKTPPSPPKEPPACTYEYSAWGECDRGTKKQIHSVTAKKPAGCVEKGKPVLEQECTPPRTAEERKIDLLNCMCFGCQTGLPSMGGYLVTEGECKGMCFCPAPLFGQCRFIVMDPEKMKRCYASAYDIKDPNANDVKNAQEMIRQANRKAMKPLKVKFDAEKCPITVQLGDIVNLRATFEGGIPPHNVSWSGNGMAKDDTFTFANSRQPGTHPISATVTDSEGGSATASCAVVVDAITVQIEKTSPPGAALPVGGKASFRAIVKSGKNQAGGELKYMWQPHPEVQFGDDKNPLFETTSPATTATYTRTGTFQMWVQVLKKMGDTYRTIGESDQIPMTIVKPGLKLSVNKNNPRIGETVIVTVQEEPKMGDDAISFWWEIKGEAANPGPEPNIPNNRAYSFKPKDTKPVTVTVHGKAKDGGDDLGEDKATITAQDYTVSLSEPKYMGSKPMIWKCDTQLGRAANCGLVEVTNQLAVFHDIFIKAGVSPEPEKPPLRYAWTIDPERICGIPGGGQELRINCSQTGTYTVKVTVRDSQDLVLGTATSPVSITISQDDLDKAKGPLVTLQADKTSLKTGETAVIKAAVQGGKAPYAYRWGDGVEGKGETARFSPKKSGAQKITLEVTDGAGKKASADVSIKVELAKLEVTLKPAKTDPKVGETVDIKAEAKGGEAPFTYLWGPGVTGKGDSVPFVAKKGGVQTVSVEVTDGARQKAKATVELKVAVPKLEVTLKADKTALKIGETALIQAVVKGGVPPVTSKWGAGVDAKGDTARFVADKPGMQKASLDVSDKAGQKATASVDLKVEVPKLEVTLTADKPVLKVGEKGTVQAKVKGGMPEYKYQWSSFVSGKGETASFIPNKTGVYKVWLEVRDKMGTKASATLDWKVGAGQAGQTSLAGGAIKIAIEPEILKLAPGETQTLRVLRVLTDGKKEPYTQGKVSWGGDASQGIVISDQGKVQATSLAKTGARVKIAAKAGPLTAEAWIEVVSSSKTAGGPAADPAGPSTAVTTTVLPLVPPTSAVPASAGYDPRTDPGNLAAAKPADLDKVNKIAGDFQKVQWTPLDDKIQKIKDQQSAQSQPQPSEYLSSSTTSVTTTIGPTDPGQPTTGQPSTAQPSTTTVGGTSKDLTDVTVDRRDVTITVWDHGTEDGDIISIYLNGKVMKSKLLLTNKKQSFRVNLTGGQNRFEVEAVNEGSMPPNTATVEISNVTKGKPSQVYERKSGQRTSMNLTAP